MALITTLVLCVRSQDLVILRAEESRVIRHVKPPSCGEAFGELRSHSCDRVLVTGALAHGFCLFVSHLNAPEFVGESSLRKSVDRGVATV